jgi:hypothetical protein
MLVGPGPVPGPTRVRSRLSWGLKVRSNGDDDRFMRKVRILLGLALVVAAGCSSDDGTTVTAGGSSDTPTTEATAPSTTTMVPWDSSTTSSTAPATTTTSSPPVTTTSAPTTTTPKPKPTTTTTTFPAGAVRLTIINEHPKPVELKVNGLSFTLAAGERRGPVPVIPAADSNDTYTAVVQGTDCGLGDAGPHFQKGPGTSVTMRLVPFGTCDPAGSGVPNLSLKFEGDWSGGH